MDGPCLVRTVGLSLRSFPPFLTRHDPKDEGRR